MPKIQIYDSQTSPGGQLRVNRATPEDFGAGTARGVRNVGNAIQQKAEKDAAYWVEETTAKARGEWAQRLTQRKDEAPLGAPGFTDTLLSDFDDYRNEVLDAAPTGASRKALNGDLERLRATLTGQAAGFEAAAGTQARLNAAGETLNTNLNTVRADPSLDPDVRAQDERLIESLDIPADKKQEVKQRQTYARGFARGSGLLDKAEDADDAQAFVDDLRSREVWKRELTETDYARLLSRAEGLVSQYKNRDKQGVLEGLKDAIPEMENGIALEQRTDWHQQIDAFIEDPKEREKLHARVDRAARLGEANLAVKDADWDALGEIRAGFEGRVQERGEFPLDVHDISFLDQAITRRAKALKDDAATYVLGNSESVGKSYDQLQAERQKAASGEQNALPEAVQDYATAMSAEQVRLRGPYAPVNLLPRTEVAAIAAGLSAVERTPEGAQQAYEVLVDQAETWGKHWPDVFRQLQAEKVLGGVEAVAARLTGPDQRVTGQTLMRAAYTGDKELWKQTGQPDSVRTELGRAVTETLAPFKATTDLQVGGDGAYRDHADAIELLAVHYVSRGERSVSKAVARASDEILLRDYELRGNFRVPRNAGVDADSAFFGAQAVQRNIADYDFVVPDSMSGLNAVDAREGAVSVLRDRGVWVTNRDETGLQFMVTEMNGEASAVLVRENGKLAPLEMSWDEVASKAPPKVDPPRGRSEVMRP